MSIGCRRLCCVSFLGHPGQRWRLRDLRGCVKERGWVQNITIYDNKNDKSLIYVVTVKKIKESRHDSPTYLQKTGKKEDFFLVLKNFIFLDFNFPSSSKS